METSYKTRLITCEDMYWIQGDDLNIERGIKMCKGLRCK